jgi:hypothetical protein
VSSAFLPPALVLGLLCLLGYAIARSTSPAVSVRDGELQIRLAWSDAFLAVCRTLRVPLSSVRAVTLAPLDTLPATGLRWPGTRLPGVIRAGSYGFGEKRDFWLVRRADTVLVIELQPGQVYRRIVLQVDDPEEVARRLAPDVGAPPAALR